MDKDAFLADKRTRQGVQWRGMRGMRNRIAHGYFDINLDVVWETVQTALPELLKQLSGARNHAQQVDESG
jgi:uncharacterized protein with HEPN domain